MKLAKNHFLACCVIASATLLNTGIRAESLGTDTVFQLNPISITAIKQGNDLSSHALSATVIDRSDAERQHIFSAKTASDIAPNVVIPDYGSRITSTIYVRGLGSRIDQPVVGLNIDNVPILNKNNYDFDMCDISRVEMIRGPQSSLFGRNTMGGVFNIYTLSPLSYQGTRLMAEYGTANSLKVAAGHYAKLSPSLGVSASAQYTSTDGFFTNLYNGEKCDWEHQGSARIKVQYDNRQGFSLENVAALSVVRQGGYPYRFIDNQTISYNDTCFYKRTALSDGLTLRFNRQNFSISSVTSVQYSDDNMTLDQDFLPIDYFTLTQANREYSFTHDLIVRSQDDKKYQWLAGLFAFYRHAEMNAPVTFLNTGISELIEEKRNQANPNYPISWDTRQFELGSKFTMPNWGVALYHQSKLHLGAWTFTAGLRADYEHSGLRFNSFSNTGYSINHVLSDGTTELFRHDDVNINDNGKLNKHFLQLLPKVAASYQLPFNRQSTAYASVSKGYKAGGYNTQMFSDVLQQRIMGMMGIGMNYDVDQIVGYKPEKAWTYEIGTHLETNNGDFTADFSLFYINCTDQQLTTFPDGTTTGRVMTNAGRSRSVGGELSLKAQLTNRLGMAASYGFTHAQFVEYNDGKQDLAHKRLPYVPQNTIYAEAYYVIPLSSQLLRSISLNVNARAIGNIYWDETNQNSQDLYALMGAQVKLQGRHFSLELWGKNLTDTNYGTFYFVSINHRFVQQGRPRQIGATLRYFF
ncbi:MAG: TonB-dependent receptor [Muribaculaceae bacterium]